MLRILRIMQFLTLLMEQVPARICVERERLEQLIAVAAESLRNSLESTEAYRDEIDQRLGGLPDQIAQGIRPEMIAERVNESLRQQFVKSTIPQTAEALAVISTQLRKSSSEFSATAASLGNSYRGAAHEAEQAINAIRESTNRAREAASKLLTTYQGEYRWSVLCSLVPRLSLAQCWERFSITGLSDRPEMLHAHDSGHGGWKRLLRPAPGT